MLPPGHLRAGGCCRATSAWPAATTSLLPARSSDKIYCGCSGTIPAPPAPSSAFEQRVLAIENGQSRRIRLHLHNNQLTGSIPSGLASLALSVSVAGLR